MTATQNIRKSALLEIEGMCKSFPGVLANDRISLSLRSGEIHALLGENGAGKSTLVKMIYGILKPDAGRMLWKGKAAGIDRPVDARQLGIAMVFQHFSLFESMSVFENILLGLERDADPVALRKDIVDISVRYGLPLDPDRHVYTLSVGERQRIEIIRCLLQKPDLLVMDEPTSVLTPQEVDRLFETLRRLCGEGVGILYISHKLDEIKALCEHATILRNGKVVASVDVAEETTQSLASKMMGKEFRTAEQSSGQEKGPVRLGIHGLDHPARDQFGISLRNVELEVHGGEIVGIAGVAGNGQGELLRVLNGEETGIPAEAIMLDGTACAHLGPNPRRALGLASVPEERLGHAAIPSLSLVENALLTTCQRLGLLKFGFINRGKCSAFSEQVVSDFNVKCSHVNAEAGSLSGGNLQKFVVGREISQSPAVMIVSQPTWGVDAGAAQTVRSALRGLANQGAAILVLSQDLDELMEISDRIAAICAGALSPALPVAETSVEQIGLMMAGLDPRQDTEAA